MIDNDNFKRLRMITSEKIKLLINDPKFRQLDDWSQGSRQQALNKIYADQKKIQRAKVVQQCLMKRQTVGEVSTTLDFLQSKIKAVESRIVDDIQQTVGEKERIQEKYKQLEDIYEKANHKYLSLIQNITPQVEYEQNLLKLQKQVNEIKELYEENLFLKNMNNQIKKRIKQKQQKAKITLPTP